jgi:hypothetical protein
VAIYRQAADHFAFSRFKDRSDSGVDARATSPITPGRGIAENSIQIPSKALKWSWFHPSERMEVGLGGDRAKFLKCRGKVLIFAWRFPGDEIEHNHLARGQTVMPNGLNGLTIAP